MSSALTLGGFSADFGLLLFCAGLVDEDALPVGGQYAVEKGSIEWWCWRWAVSEISSGTRVIDRHEAISHV